MDEHKCRLALCRVLAGNEVCELKRRFSRVGSAKPLGEYLGVIDLRNSPDCIECAFRFAWGSESYCDNQDVLLTLRLEELKALGKRSG